MSKFAASQKPGLRVICHRLVRVRLVSRGAEHTESYSPPSQLAPTCDKSQQTTKLRELGSTPDYPFSSGRRALILAFRLLDFSQFLRATIMTA